MSRPSFNFDNITADKAEKLQQDFAQHKRDTARPPKPPEPEKKDKEPAKPAFTKRDEELLRRQADKVHGKQEQDANDKKMKAEMKTKHALMRKYESYYRNETLVVLLPPPRKLDPNKVTLEDMHYLIDEIHQCIARHRCREIAPKVIVEGIGALEKALVDSKFDSAVGLDGLEGFTNTLLKPLIANKDPHLNIEIEEMTVELEDWFTAPYYMRFAFTVYNLARYHCQAQQHMAAMKSKTRKPKPASSETDHEPNPGQDAEGDE